MASSIRARADLREVQTGEYYERNAASYFHATRRTDLSALYEPFLGQIPSGGRILDAGSGSGRDTLAFLRRGYKVSAFDASPALCALSTRLTGVATRVLRFQEVIDEGEYDGIWACASLLHVPEPELTDSIGRLIRALKPRGVLYMSFKRGMGDRVSNDGRFFSDMTTERITRILENVPDARLGNTWATAGEGKFRGRDEWLNALVFKQEHGAAYG